MQLAKNKKLMKHWKMKMQVHFMIKIIWVNKMRISLCSKGIKLIKIGIKNLETNSKMFLMKLIKENQKIMFYFLKNEI